MRATFKNDQETFHVFAQQVQERGKSGNTSFDGTKVYSYNQCIGNISGNNIFLINWNYSVTTGAHNSYLRSATSHYRQIFIKYPSSPKDSVNKEDFQKQYNNILTSLASAKKPEIYVHQFNQLKTNIQNYLDALPDLLDSHKSELKAIIDYNIEDQKLLDKIKERIKKEKEREQQKLKIAIDDFRSFESNYIPKGTYSYLRVKGNLLQTSKGVEIELSKVIPFIELYKKGLINRDYHTKLIGKHIDSFIIETVNDNFVKIGCHTITKEEILNIKY